MIKNFLLSCKGNCSKNKIDIDCIKCSYSEVITNDTEEDLHDKQDKYAANFGA